jgi:hypothetical protein
MPPLQDLTVTFSGLRHGMGIGIASYEYSISSEQTNRQKDRPKKWQLLFSIILQLLAHRSLIWS